MRFTSFGLFAISALFATTSAAPTALDVAVPAVADVQVKTPIVSGLISRTDAVDDVCSKLVATVAEVKKHTSVINATISGVDHLHITKELTVTIKGEVTAIVQILVDLSGELSVILGETTELVGDVKTKVVGLVVELIMEILFTLNGVVTTLKICKYSPQVLLPR